MENNNNISTKTDAQDQEILKKEADKFVNDVFETVKHFPIEMQRDLILMVETRLQKYYQGQIQQCEDEVDRLKKQYEIYAKGQNG